MTGTHLAHLRLRTTEPDSPTWRLAVARELGGAEVAPGGLPPAAVMLVRRLEDPQPGLLGSGGFRPPAVWERAVRNRLAEAHRRAVRPDSRGRVPAAAATVVFADPAELIACRLRILVAGEAVPWWADRLPAELGAVRSGQDRDAFSLLRHDLRELPAVFHRLAAWGAAAPVLRSLNEPQAAQLLAELVQEWSLPAELAGHPPTSPAVPEKARVRRSSDKVPIESRQTGELRPKGHVLYQRIDDPWTAWLPRELAVVPLAPAVRALTGVAFGLLRSPSRLRSRGQVARVAGWWRQVATGREGSLQSVEAGASRDIPTSGEIFTVREARSQARDSRNEATISTAAARSRDSGEVARPGSFDPEPVARAVPEPPPDPENTESGARLDGKGREDRLPTDRIAFLAPGPWSPFEISAAGDPHPTIATSQEEVRAGTPQAPVQEPVETSSPDSPYLNLPSEMRAGLAPQPACEGDGAPIDGESPQIDASPDPLVSLTWSDDTFVTAWGGVFYLIHLLEEQDRPRVCEDDWRLATLAGPWGTLDLVARGLLAHRFPEIAGDPLWPVLEQLAGWPDEAGARSPGFRLAFPLPLGCPLHLGGWLAGALPALRHRLLLALGEDALLVTADPIERLLAVPASIHLTSSHLDLVTGLDHIWLPARRAGLDRNPGWLPEYGRVVLFHFVETIHFDEPGGVPS